MRGRTVFGKDDARISRGTSRRSSDAERESPCARAGLRISGACAARRLSSATTLRRGSASAGVLEQLLGDAEQALAPLHLLPDFLRLHAGGDPEHDEIVDEVGAFLDDGVAAAVHRVDHDFDGLFGELLGHLGAAGAQQPRGARACRIAMPSGDHPVIEALDRISHAPTIAQVSLLVVNK